MTLRVALVVFVAALVAGCSGGEQVAGPADEATPTPEPTVEPTPNPTPTPVPDPCLGETNGFEPPNAPDAGASFVMLTFGDNVDGFVIDTGSIDIVGTYWLAACGVQSMDLSGGEPGAIHREMFTTAGAAYRVRFAFSGNPYDDSAPKFVRILWDGVELDELAIVTDGFGPEDMGWKWFEYDVTASGSTARLTFESLTPGVYGPALDGISVTAL